MRSSAETIITLPQDLADRITAKVAEGGYASPAEVVREGLRAIEERDAVVEHWLQTDVAASFDRYISSPAEAISLADSLLELDRYMNETEQKSA